MESITKSERGELAGEFFWQPAKWVGVMNSNPYPYGRSA
jgi:hypothetical protein